MLTAQNVFLRKPWQRASSTCTTRRCTCTNDGVSDYVINNRPEVFTGNQNPQKTHPLWLRLCNVVRPLRPRVTVMIVASAPFERHAWLKGKGVLEDMCDVRRFFIYIVGCCGKNGQCDSLRNKRSWIR